MDAAPALAAAWGELAPIGRDDADGGYHRFAWTPADRELRAWFAATARAGGLEVEVDRNGNQWAWWGDPGEGSVVVGSHLDSVPDGGAFDGPLGVVSALLAVADLRARGVRPARPVAVVNFADEEGARFGVACAGSRLLTGALDPGTARDLADRDGITLGAAMAAEGLDPAGLGRDEQALARIGVFLELHVEQGRGLVDAGAAVGVASAIWPHGRWRFRFGGESNHAGTTGLGDRRDPMLPLAATVLAARDLAAAGGALATIGRVEVRPGATNAIAASVDAWLDGRAPDEAAVTRLVEELTAVARRAGAAEGVTVEVTRESWSPPVEFASPLRERLRATLGGVPVLPTGAGHDAGILSAHVPTAMLFVRNPTGVSHSPREHADPRDALAGVRALTRALEDLAA